MSFLHKPHQFLPNVYSHPARKPAHFGKAQANLSPSVLEALQVLKFSYKQDWLTFTSDFIAEEADYSISGLVSINAIDELMAAGRIDELTQLLMNQDDENK